MEGFLAGCAESRTEVSKQGWDWEKGGRAGKSQTGMMGVGWNSRSWRVLQEGPWSRSGSFIAFVARSRSGSFKQRGSFILLLVGISIAQAWKGILKEPLGGETPSAAGFLLAKSVLGSRSALPAKTLRLLRKVGRRSQKGNRDRPPGRQFRLRRCASNPCLES